MNKTLTVFLGSLNEKKEKIEKQQMLIIKSCMCRQIIKKKFVVVLKPFPRNSGLYVNFVITSFP